MQRCVFGIYYRRLFTAVLALRLNTSKHGTVSASTQHIVRPTQGPCVERLRLSVTDDVSWAYVRFDVALAFQHFALDEPTSAWHFHAPASTGAQLFTSAIAVGPQPSRSPQTPFGTFSAPVRPTSCYECFAAVWNNDEEDHDQ